MFILVSCNETDLGVVDRPELSFDKISYFRNNCDLVIKVKPDRNFSITFFNKGTISKIGANEIEVIYNPKNLGDKWDHVTFCLSLFVCEWCRED